MQGSTDFRWSGFSFAAACMVFASFYPTFVTAAVVRHTLRPTDQAFTVQTQHSCGTYLLQPEPHWCNPALFAFVKDATIKSDLALNADSDAYDTTDRLLNRPIDQKFVEELFREKDFQSFSSLARLEAVNSYLSFSYIPVYAVGAYKLSNPNLPELDAVGLRESQFRLLSGMRLVTVGEWSLFGGASIFWYDRKQYYIHTNALELVVRSIDEILQTDRMRGLDSDAGLFLSHGSGVFPAFALVGENLSSPQHKVIGADHILAIEPIFRRRFRIEAGYTYGHTTGNYALGLSLPFWDAAAAYDRLGIAASFIYGIGRLRVFTSYSPLMSAFGFLFMASNYHIGIQYTNDKQDNSLEIRRRKNVNLFLSVNF